MFNMVKSGYAKLGVLVAMALPAVAFAQATDPFTVAIVDATAKVGLYAAALVGIGAVGVVFRIALKYVKKIPSAA